MSKTSLRKYLKDFDAPQMQALIMDIYSRSKDAKEYLDFMAEPDVEAKLEDYRKIINKEATRYTKRAFHPRLSRINAAIKRFSTFEPGDEAVAELKVSTLLTLIGNGVECMLPDMLYARIELFMIDVLDYLKERGMVGEFVPRILRRRRDLKKLRRMENPLRRIIDDSLAKAGVDLSQYDLS